MKQALIKLHISVFLAGFTGILGRLILLNEGLLVWYRLFITIVTMWVLLSFTKKLTRISKKDILKLTGVGFLSALHWVTFYGSIKYANVSVALVCFSAVGFFTAFIEPVIVKRKLNWVEVLLGLLVMIGIYIIFHFDPHYKVGIILGIISALLIAIAMILLRQFVQRINGETVLTYQLTGGLFVLTLFMPLYLNLFPVKTVLPGLSDWGWLLILSWICSVWAFQLTTHALKKLSAFTVNLTFNLEPVYGILMAFIFFNEAKDLSSGFYYGLALIILSVILQMWRVIKLKKH
ncbi:MAG: DMT family transporter [Sphingobacteriales bacterium]|nr:DMT family transporter [Sphingobacteriales bacterium]MBI3719282.1 DMT family transporter [Sphingobacteriales bacterium]